MLRDQLQEEYRNRFAAKPEYVWALKFDESKHPRDAKGQFVTLYHGTREQSVESILKEGLRPDASGVVFATESREEAQRFAEGLDYPQPTVGATVVEIRAPRTAFFFEKSLTPGRKIPAGQRTARFPAKVRPEWIKRVQPETCEAGEPGQCFANVNRWNARYGGKADRVVHGKVTNAEGKTFDHAWIERADGKVVDPTTGVVLPKKQYYDLLQAKPEASYTSTEAIRNQMRFMQHGPWTTTKWDRNQPRDEKGRWEDKGGSREEFEALASQQRGKPEDAMLKVQHLMGGGVINPAVEHTGDLMHRMNERVTFETAGYEFVKPKVDRILRSLRHGYGFEKEFEENITNNAAYRKIDEEAYRQSVYAALEEYAKAHEALPVYNKAQALAQEASVAIGRRYFAKAARVLMELQVHLETRDEWIRFAREGLVLKFDEAKHPRDKQGRWLDTGGIERWHIGPSGERPYGWSYPSGEQYTVPKITHTVKRLSNWGTWGGSHHGSKTITGEAAKIMGLKGYTDYNGTEEATKLAEGLLAQIATDQTGSEEVLYHSFENVRGTEFAPGDTLSLPLTATAGNVMNYGVRGWAEAQMGQPVVFEFEPGTQMAPYGGMSKRDAADMDMTVEEAIKERGFVWDEAIVAGAFEVVSVREEYFGSQHSEPGKTPAVGAIHQIAGKVVRLRQTKTFDPVTKTWKSRG